MRKHQATGAKLSSHQDFAVLDRLIVGALEPLEAETTAYKEWLAEVAAFTLTSRRRDNDALVRACVMGICGTRSASIISATGIDRAHAFVFLNRAGKIGKALENAQIAFVRQHGKRVSDECLRCIRAAKQALGNNPSILPAIRASRYWTDLALAHKAEIISHYMRLMFKVASRISHTSGNRIEVNPAFNDAYLTASEAVDYFRADRGVFASYLGLHLKGSIRSSAKQALGLAAPGARVASADALQADPIDGALEISDPTVGPTDISIIARIDSIAADADVRAALVVSDIEPPEIARLHKPLSKHREHEKRS